MKKQQNFKFGKLALTVGFLCASLATQYAHAQLSTATIRGIVSISSGSLPAGIEVLAVNSGNGTVARTKTRADGSYTLVGLAPGSYQIKVVGKNIDQKIDDVVVQVGDSADVNIALPAADTKSLDKVVIKGSITRKDVKTSSVGTNISTKQIDALPQNSRNFLAFADQAPGVRFDVDSSSGQAKLRSGAQNQDNVNVFIDGVGQKNYILRGGASGQDSTRGNPFPQLAVQEYKVIGQNYKAEFDQVSSAAITAVTKSGTNETHGEVFMDRTGSNWTAYNQLQKKDAENGVTRSAYSQWQYGASLGGAIKEDVLHYFLTFEGKKIDSPRQVVVQNANLLPNAGITPSLMAMQGSTISSFNEGLLFGKFDATINDEHKLTFTGRLRRESDKIPEDYLLSAPGNGKNRINDETRLELKHEWRTDNWLNEARIGYEDYRWNPRSDANSPEIKYYISSTNSSTNTQNVLNVGGSPDAQNKRQKGFLFQNDYSFNGIQNHAIKVGGKIKLATFDLDGTARSIDVLNTLIDNTTGATSVFRVDPAIAPKGVKLKDNQIGLYVQDDWRVNKQLELNLGVRWDYETNMLNNSYATPADRVAIFDVQDPRTGAAVGQTYAQSLAKGGINISDYISTGNSRKNFLGAIQPRLGFSYDLKGDTESVVFGGFGRSYDRTIANNTLDELQKNAVSNGEIWMIRNKHKMPFTDQFALGLRQKIETWNGEVGYTYAHAKNQFNWFGGNRDVNGGFGDSNPTDPLWGSVGGYGTLVLGDFNAQSKTQQLYFKLDKPYTRASGWGLYNTYTYSDGKTTNNTWTDDIFNWTYGKSTAGWNPSKNVEKHRLVTSVIVDNILPWGLQLAGKLTLGSGLPRQLTDCTGGAGTCHFVEKKGGLSVRWI